MRRNLLSILVIFAISGCAHVDTPAGEVTYAAGARQNYDLGMKALEAGRHLDALKFFEHVRAKYPYSTQAALAELAIGDTHFDREKYLEAIEAYRAFLKMHPNHPRADYASFRIALSYYEDIPSDFVLFPPSTQKDQSSVRDARVAFEQFLRDYASSSHAAEAKRLLDDVRLRLAKHELYVADFYMHRKRWKAAVGRLNRLLADFPGSSLEAEALLKLGRSHKELDEKEKAREALERLMREFPDAPQRPEAERLLQSV
jgi:outer membrane protein assembly factor BamD